VSFPYIKKGGRGAAAMVLYPTIILGEEEKAAPPLTVSCARRGGEFECGPHQ